MFLFSSRITREEWREKEAATNKTKKKKGGEGIIVLEPTTSINSGTVLLLGMSSCRFIYSCMCVPITLFLCFKNIFEKIKIYIYIFFYFKLFF